MSLSLSAAPGPRPTAAQTDAAEIEWWRGQSITALATEVAPPSIQ